jgi:glycosyltransferase involved in cell wall biosynthesis
MNDPQLNLFVDAHCFDQEYQGSATFIKQVYTIFQSYQNIHIHLAAYDIENLKKEFPGDNFTFIKYKSRSTFIRLFYDIPRIIRKYRIDYAHYQYIMPFFGNCRSIVTMHDVLFMEWPDDFPFFYRISRKYLFRRAARKADIVTTVSGYSKYSIIKNFRLDEEKIVVIPNGVSRVFFEWFDKNVSKQMIFHKYGVRDFLLYVSRIEPRKNHTSLIRSFLSLKLFEKGYHLFLVGHGSLPVPGLNDAIKKISAEEKKYIHFISNVSEEELLQLYRAADLFIYPSKAEGFGIPPLEAAAVGIPVICSNTTGMSAYTFFGDNHIDPVNEELMKERIAAELENNENERTDIIRQRIRKDYSWSSPARQLYESIMYHSGNDFPTVINHLQKQKAIAII